jgi:hypothetical protein
MLILESFKSSGRADLFAALCLHNTASWYGSGCTYACECREVVGKQRLFRISQRSAMRLKVRQSERDALKNAFHVHIIMK